MRLTQIKLSGFKSFAEPTTFQLPGRRVGVVGPNGCGKSNVIDAVRWVLGESKASELRGESMQDVIFNGSGLRKPAGRASVELVFDNAAARAGGQWNAFAEIAVRRVLTRDGTSGYSINGQPVRRRDVQDVFLGTGLGPRAYAIIGQGTISRIIESRPEELRLFLEEAAGVSKYKERRRETESRLRDTRDNLVRVEDILRELNANLDKLATQAEVAGRYRRLQDDGTLKLHQLWWLKSRDAAAEEARVQAAAAAAATALEAQLAELRATESALEAMRQSHYAAGDALHDAQGQLGDAALAVSRLEERIRYVVEGRARAQARLDEIDAQHAGWTARQAAAADELQALAGGIGAADDAAGALAAQAEEAGLALPALEDDARAAQSAASRQRGAVAQVQQQIQVLAADSRNVAEQQRQLNARRDRLAGERRGLQAPDAARIDTLHAEEAAALALRDATATALQTLADRLPALDAERRDAQHTVNTESARAADIAARLSALRALQARVQTGGKLQPWLQRHGLDGLAPLWSRLHVEPGWEAALEAALRERLNALAVSRLDGVAAFADDAPPARLAFYALPQEPAASAAGVLPLLSARLRLGDAALQSLLDDWLTGVHTAESVADALAARAALRPGELVLTREGHAVGRHAVAWYAPDSENAGMLARAQEIENLDREQRAQALIVDGARSASVRLEAAYTEMSARLAQARHDAADAQTRAHTLHVELVRLTQQSSAATQRGAQLDDELAETDARLEALEERRITDEARFDALDADLADAQQRHAELDDAVIAADRLLTEAREQQRTLERRAQEAQFQARTLLARQGELQRAIETAAAQLLAAAGGREQALAELRGHDDAAAQSGLQDALFVRLAREQTLAAARSRYDDLTAQLRRTDEQRMAAEQALEPLRDTIGRLQLDLLAARLGGAQYVEQLGAAAVDLAVLEQSVASGGVKLWGLQTEIDRINRDIAELGAVNLAALDELTQGRERKTFLDAQLADLAEAIQTLEGAIHTIDLETRQLLSATFEQVNDGFGRMFPVLFGGGTARLVMTGDEILDAGVQVMAQPPGKKNSTIHLLSGGEKALTAIALVFAIFQLNPAPFCLLDEVDAPLDDANTERYCKLVTQMSAGTQFLYISHNRIAMEMAEQLIGVTMQEQGVSRIVAVDVESAVGLAEAA